MIRIASFARPSVALESWIFSWPRDSLRLRLRCSSASSPSFYSSSTRPSSTSTPSKHEVILSGIQPTGVPHLGNYLGALRQWVRMQDEAPSSTSLLYSIVDLHSLTSHQPAAFRRQSKREVLAAFLAVGLDPERSTIFYQSDVPAHSELHWILSCDTSVGLLSRMTQWKSKLGVDEVAALFSQTPNPENRERLKLGLFTYPVLQAADVLVHGTTKVPVGEDQQQHIEFARNCAAQFNHVYGNGEQILSLPEVVLSPFKRVMSLTEPDRKMSKSHESAWSRITLSDSPDTIAKKFKKAVTDSEPGITYDREKRPGVSNLIDIISHVEDIPPSEVAAEFRDVTNLRFLKERASQSVIKELGPITQRYETLMHEDSGRALDEIANRGAEKANASARNTMRRVREAIGI